MKISKAEYHKIFVEIANRMKQYKHNDKTCKLCKTVDGECGKCILVLLYPNYKNMCYPCKGIKNKLGISFNNKRMATIVENEVIPRLDAKSANDPFFTGVKK